MYIFVAIAYHLARQSRSHACALLRTNKSDSANVLTKQMKDFLVGLWQQSAVERPRELSLLSTLGGVGISAGTARGLHSLRAICVALRVRRPRAQRAFPESQTARSSTPQQRWDLSTRVTV